MALRGISVVVGGAAGFALGTFCAATIAMDSIGARASAGREAIGWALGYAIAALMFMWPADEGAGGRGRFVICVPLFGLLGGLFQAIGRAGPHFPKHATLTIVTMAAWALAVSVGAILSVHPIYLLLEIGSRTMEPVSEVTGAILGSGLGGLFGGTTAALLGWWLEPSWSHQ